MDERLKNQLAEIETRKNYLEMENVLSKNISLMKEDPEFCIYVIKCVINGGFAGENNGYIIKELEKCKKSDSKDVTLMEKILGKIFNKKSNANLESGANSVIKLTNMNLMDSVKTVLIYGNNELIEEASNLMATLYPGFAIMMNKSVGISAKAYALVAQTMCNFGKMIMDNVKLTNKANFPGAKNMIGAFATEVMKPILDFIKGGILGFVNATSIDNEMKEYINVTYKNLLSMK